jgi:hypothetical protein
MKVREGTPEFWRGNLFTRDRLDFLVKLFEGFFSLLWIYLIWL